MTDKYDMPNERGHFGPYGGIFVAETLIPAITELNEAYQHYIKDPVFLAELGRHLCIMPNVGVANSVVPRFI